MTEKFDAMEYWKERYEQDNQHLKEVIYEMKTLKERYTRLKERRDKSKAEYLKFCTNPLPPFNSK